MPLHALSDDERRSHCRREIEALEHWLRRLVDETFLEFYGKRYLDPGGGGRRPFSSEAAREISRRRGDEPDRYARPVGAATLDELVRVICKPDMYNRHFKPAFETAFPLNNEMARVILKRIADIRNKLSHANPITVHDAARVLCYTQDVLVSLKEYYASMNKGKEYNVPTIIKVADSNANVFHATQIKRNLTGAGICRVHDQPSGRLRPGDRLSVEVEIDPTFERPSYELVWIWKGKSRNQFVDSDRIVLDVENGHIHPQFCIHCRVTSNKDWHRLGDHDDSVAICYTVLPPVL